MTTKLNASTAGLVETVDTSGILELQTANTTAITIDTSQNINCASTGAIIVPTGTTAQRPTAANGMLRYNTSISNFESYINNAWGVFTVTFAPVNSVAPVISGSVSVGSNLTSTTGTWTNTPTSYAYQWLANSTSIVANATANVFTLTATQTGANITCNVTAVNAAGNATATSNSLGPVVATYSLAYLSVAGGGGASYGGGGAGGLLSNAAVTVAPGDVFTVTIGAGGTAGGTSTNGANTVIASTTSGFTNITCIGGGNTSVSYSGNTGGSGGGGWYTGTGGAGTAGQGNAGGNGITGRFWSGGNGWAGGGGGGAGQAGLNGGNPNSNYPGYGGNGSVSTITGSSVTYAGGGGGGFNYDNGSTGFTPLGGSGGGGNGSTGSTDGGQAGTVNTGGGGGGGCTSGYGTYFSGQGGSGVVILSVPTSKWSNTYTGTVTVTTSGSNTIAKFTTSGSYTA